MTQLSLWEQWTDAEKQRAYEKLLRENWSLRHALRDVEDVIMGVACCPGGPAVIVKRLGEMSKSVVDADK